MDHYKNTTFTFNPAEFNSTPAEVVELFGKTYKFEQSNQHQVTLHIMEHLQAGAIDYIFHTLGEKKKLPLAILPEAKPKIRKISKSHSFFRQKIMPPFRLLIILSIIGTLLYLFYKSL